MTRTCDAGAGQSAGAWRVRGHAAARLFLLVSLISLYDEVASEVLRSELRHYLQTSYGLTRVFKPPCSKSNHRTTTSCCDRLLFATKAVVVCGICISLGFPWHSWRDSQFQLTHVISTEQDSLSAVPILAHSPLASGNCG